MSDLEQQIFRFECDSCSWSQSGFCVGPRRAAAYLMQAENYTSCLDTVKRERLFSDTFKPIYLPQNRRRGQSLLPDFIPTIVESRFSLPDDIEGLTVGVSLGNIIGRRGHLSCDSVDKIRDRFGLPKSAKIALIGTGDDQRLENLWKIHETERIFERIATMGFSWATSLTYSVWQEEFPRPDQLRNQWRNYRTYDIFTSFGLPCIPFVFPVEESDFQNLARWLRERQEVKTVAVYAHYYHGPEKFKAFCAFLRRVERLADRRIRFLVCGIGKAENIAHLNKKFECHFENSKMFAKTIHGEICDAKLKYSRSMLPLTSLFRINLSRNMDFVSGTKSRPIIYLQQPKQVLDKWQPSRSEVAR